MICKQNTIQREHATFKHNQLQQENYDANETFIAEGKKSKIL